jgi:tetratricopeptide (TPR) repeat protein
MSSQRPAGRTGRLLRSGAHAILSLLACACSAGLPSAALPAHGSDTGTPLEERHLDRANKAMREERWSAAAVEWEILSLLRPDRRDYADRTDEARSRAATTAIEYVNAATQARQRGDAQRAVYLYLRALSADPARADVAQALRDIERERALRSEVSAVVSLPSERSSRSSSQRPPKGSDLEAAVMTLRQGDYDASIKALESYLRRYPGDPLAKRSLREAYTLLGKEQIAQGKKEEALRVLEKAQPPKQARSDALVGTLNSLRKDLAREYHERALRTQRTDIDEAIRLWEQSIQYDPQLTEARLRLEQARRMRDSLKLIEESGKK